MIPLSKIPEPKIASALPLQAEQHTCTYIIPRTSSVSQDPIMRDIQQCEKEHERKQSLGTIN